MPGGLLLCPDDVNPRGLVADVMQMLARSAGERCLQHRSEITEWPASVGGCRRQPNGGASRQKPLPFPAPPAMTASD